ncbi:MAG: 16S rRNA (cytosine(967)-C(5))-methyltransferase RsmB [Burkholderiales bacterium]
MEREQAAAALAVRRVLDGSTLPVALAAAPTELSRAFVQELAYGTLRHWGRLAALAEALSARPLEVNVAALLAVALYQLDHTRSPAFAVVDRAVDAVALLGRPQAKGAVNAMLRRYLRERETLNEQVAGASPVARWSHPRWWIGRLQADHPADWESILAAGNERPPLTLRVNCRVVSREQALTNIRDAGIEATPVGASGIVVAEPRPVAEIPGFADGWLSVQDAGAQLAAPLLEARDGMRVLDACAAPGGKTTHIAELADVDLTALDADPARAARISENIARLRLGDRSIRVTVGDAGSPQDWWDGRPFDRILADVPCTASGIVRRHPDSKWLRRRSDIASFGEQQRRLLGALWPLLAPGGALLYVTCSVFDAENEQQIKAFVEAHPGALRESITFPPDVLVKGGQLLPSGNAASHNQDGFFYARLRKS